MHENGRLYFEGNAGENAPANTKNAPAAIKTGVPAAAGLPGPQERKHSLGRWTSGRNAQIGRCLISCIYHQCFRRYRCARPKRINRPKPPPANTSKTPRISLAVISLYHSLWALSIKSRKKPAQQPVPGRCAYAYRLPGWRGMYVPMGPVFISPWSTASVPRR